RAHEHANVLALTYADRDQPAHHVVDPLSDLSGVVRAVLEQEQLVVWRTTPALLDQQTERDPGARLDLLESRQPGKLPGRFPGQPAHSAHRPAGCADGRPGHPGSEARGQLHSVADAVADLRRQINLAIVGYTRQVLRHITDPGLPAGPRCHRRPA